MESRREENSLVIDVGGCKTLAVLNTFSLYSSAFIIASIAIDQYLTLARPAVGTDQAVKRARIMAWAAWICSGISSSPEVHVAGANIKCIHNYYCCAKQMPPSSQVTNCFIRSCFMQAMVYRVESHPVKTWLKNSSFSQAFP